MWSPPPEILPLRRRFLHRTTPYRRLTGAHCTGYRVHYVGIILDRERESMGAHTMQCQPDRIPAASHPSRLGIIFCFTTAGLLGCGADDGARNRLDAPCEVSFRPLATLGADAGVSGPSEGSTVVGSDGLYLVPETYEPGKVSMFDSNGRLVRTIGAHGEGPGEQLEASDIEVVRDTAYVYDSRRGRVSRYRLTGEYLGTAAPAPQSSYTPFVPREGGGVAVLRHLRAAGESEVDVLAGDSLLHRFRISNEATLASREGATEASAIVRDEGGVALWVGYVGRYLFERYAYDGTRLSRMSEEPSWFPPSTNADGYDTIAAVMDIEVDDRGRLLVLMGRASRSAIEDGLARDRDDQLDVAAPRIGEVVLQVLDPTTGRIVADWIGSDPWLKGFADHQRVFERSTAIDGQPILKLFRIDLTDPLTGEACDERPAVS